MLCVAEDLSRLAEAAIVDLGFANLSSKRFAELTEACMHALKVVAGVASYGQPPNPAFDQIVFAPQC